MKTGTSLANLTSHLAPRPSGCDPFTAGHRECGPERRIRGEPRGRAAPLQGRIAEIYSGQGYGQIIATDHRLIYFHKNSVVDGEFADLKVDDPVELVVQAGESEKGPRASTVRPIGSLQFVDRVKK